MYVWEVLVINVIRSQEKSLDVSSVYVQKNRLEGRAINGASLREVFLIYFTCYIPICSIKTVILADQTNVKILHHVDRANMVERQLNSRFFKPNSLIQKDFYRLLIG